MSDSIYTVRFRCTNSNCKAEDSETSAHPTPGPLNCYKCHAGMGKPIDEMRKMFVGMFRLDDHAWIVKNSIPAEEAALS